MKIWGIGLILLGVALLLHLVAIRGQLRKIQRELKEGRVRGYNSPIKIELIDKNLNELTMEINRNLEYQKNLRLEKEQQEEAIRQSISEIAHDLRTPLTVVNGYLQLMEKGDCSGEEKEQYLIRCRKKVEWIQDSLDEFFELCLWESHTEPPALQRMDINQYLMEFLLENEILIRERGLQPKLVLPEHPVRVLAEEEMLFRICTNLLANVLRYSGGEFLVQLEEEEKICKMIFGNTMKDNRLHTDRLFERSYVGNQAGEEGGTGLGLYIVKLLMEKSGGSVEARREGEWLYLELRFLKEEEILL